MKIQEEEEEEVKFRKKKTLLCPTTTHLFNKWLHHTFGKWDPVTDILYCIPCLLSLCGVAGRSLSKLFFNYPPSSPNNHHTHTLKNKGRTIVRSDLKVGLGVEEKRKINELTKARETSFAGLFSCLKKIFMGKL